MPTWNEDELIAQFNHAKNMYDAFSREVEQHFLPRVRAALEAGDVTTARLIVARIPSDSLAQVFALDLLRQATK